MLFQPILVIQRSVPQRISDRLSHTGTFSHDADRAVANTGKIRSQTIVLNWTHGPRRTQHTQQKGELLENQVSLRNQ
jgi:hypothetical protein